MGWHVPELRARRYLAIVEDLLGLPRLATVTSTPSMLQFFQP